MHVGDVQHTLIHVHSRCVTYSINQSGVDSGVVENSQVTAIPL
jgi:hypothetical protein